MRGASSPRSSRSPATARREDHPRIDVGDGERADLEGPQIRLRRDRPRRRLYLHGRHVPTEPPARGAAPHRTRSARPTACASPTSFTPATATCIRWCSIIATIPSSRRRRRTPARDAQALRRARRLPDRRARRRHREARSDALQFSPADLDQQMRVRAVFDPDWRLESGQGVSARSAKLKHHANQLFAGASRRPAHARLGEDRAHLRALRLLHRDLPDLSAARRRTRLRRAGASI